MSTQPPSTDEVFPKGTTKSFTLVELVRGESQLVGKGPEKTVFSFPIVLLWEIILLLAITLGIFLFSLSKQAPLGEIANPMVTTDPAKAPWYFVGLQELLEHMHPTLAGILIPTALLLFLVSLPYIDYSRQGVGLWFSSQRGRRISAWTALYTLVVMPLYIVLDNAFPFRELLRETVPDWIANGLIPLASLLILVVVPLLVLWRLKADRHEIMLAVFTVMLSSALVFTISGFLFRGPGFKLYWPWEMPEGYNPWAEL